MDEIDGPPQCSARGCRAAARWAVVWNNPAVHTPDREKVWAACDEHREHLADYLGVRHFLIRVDPLPAGAMAAAEAPEPGASGGTPAAGAH